jgi:hypothetical protein
MEKWHTELSVNTNTVNTEHIFLSSVFLMK